MPARRTLSPVQLGETIFTRTSVLGRLVAFAAVGGVLAAAMVVPVVAATGVLVRNEANKFTTLSLAAQGLPQRSEIFDRYGHFLAYVYGVDVPYYNRRLQCERAEVLRLGPAAGRLQPDRAEHGERGRGHRGLPVLGARRDRPARHHPRGGERHRAQAGPGRFHDRAAVREERAPARGRGGEQQPGRAGRGRGDAEPQAERAADGGGRRAPAVQAGHPGRIPERRLLRQFRLRDRGRRRDLLRHQRGEAVGDPGGHPGRHRGEPERLRPDPAPRDGPRAAQYRAGPDGPDQQRAHRGAGHGRRGQAARPEILDTRERLPVQFGGHGRLLLPVRGGGLPARPGLRQDADGPGQAALHRRPEDLHHAEPGGPAGREQRGELRRARQQQLLEPGSQRGHRGRGAAGHRPDPGHRRGPAVRPGQGSDRDQLRGEHRLRRQYRGPDRFLLQAVHAHHRAQAGLPVRLPDARAGQHHRHRLHQLPGRPGRPIPGPERRLQRDER